jgi:glycosyltransferase involved in cell wall biosynthesis
MKSRVTVIIPNYNGSRFLESLFNSLMAQTYKNFQVIFVDDGSTDDSVSIAKIYLSRFSDMQIRLFENGGIAANWNRGLSLAETEFFTLLHCDDEYDPNYLNDMIRLMDRFPDSAIGHSAAKVIDASSKTLFSLADLYKEQFYPKERDFCRPLDDQYLMLLSGDYIVCPAVMYRRELISSVGKFSEHLLQTLDWEYWFRVLLAGHTISGTSRRLYKYRRHGSNTTDHNSDNLLRYQEEIETLSWAVASAPNLVETTGYDKTVLRNILISDVGLCLRRGDKCSARLRMSFMLSNYTMNFAIRLFCEAMVSLGRVGGILILLAGNAVFGLKTLVSITNIRRVCSYVVEK